jgi:hypothetical protein
MTVSRDEERRLAALAKLDQPKAEAFKFGTDGDKIVGKVTRRPGRFSPAITGRCRVTGAQPSRRRPRWRLRCRFRTVAASRAGGGARGGGLGARSRSAQVLAA